MAVTRHTANVVYSIFNSSIISITNVSFGVRVPIDPSELLTSDNATFNNPGIPSSKIHNPHSNHVLGDWAGLVNDGLQNLIVLSFVFFQSKNFPFCSSLNNSTKLDVVIINSLKSKLSSEMRSIPPYVVKCRNCILAID